MLIVSIFLFIITIFTSKSFQQVSTFSKIPADVLRHISEYTDYPFLLRSLNKAAYTAIPSAQTIIAQKFQSQMLKYLANSPELWHLIKSDAQLENFLKDSSRFLPQSFPLIAETVLIKLIDKSIQLPSNQLQHFLKVIEKQKLFHLIPPLLFVHLSELLNEE